MSENETGGSQREAFGAYLRAQRQLAQLSLRELAALTDVSNAYLSQLERGLHAPSVRVLRALAASLHVPLAQLLAQFDLAEPGDGSAAAPPTDPPPARERDADGDVEAAIHADPRLPPDAKQAMLAVYRSLRR
ncbi:MAG: helix-turn-helix domain-containing protein [Solirubrobacteraceae bacterium]